MPFLVIRYRFSKIDAILLRPRIFLLPRYTHATVSMPMNFKSSALRSLSSQVQKTMVSSHLPYLQLVKPDHRYTGKGTKRPPGSEANMQGRPLSYLTGLLQICPSSFLCRFRGLIDRCADCSSHTTCTDRVPRALFARQGHSLLTRQEISSRNE